MDEAVICISCGCSVRGAVPTAVTYTPPVVPPSAETEEPSTATWSKILGILSFFVGWFALGITAMVLAYLSKDDTGGTMCPSARVGHICGLISTILSGVLFVILIAVFASSGLYSYL